MLCKYYSQMLSISLTLALVVATTFATDRPIIGILSLERANEVRKGLHVSYIAASYVKTVEASGARVVPIALGKEQDYYEDLMSKINGVVFPGGGVYFTDPKGYGEAGLRIYNIAKKMNDEGDHFPLMGICLGYEFLMFAASGTYDILTPCSALDPLPLNFLQAYNQSKLFSNFPEDIIDILATLPVTVNHHRKCVTIEKLKTFDLDKEWTVMTTNNDSTGIEFVSSSESLFYPFAGVQFHPEKNPYEWKASQNYPHSKEAVLSSRYFLDWIVDQARLNNHSFPSLEEENQALIYNYSPVFIGQIGGYYEQIYRFVYVK
uniref:folate gamma-glutamyl hydrolase n=2 Tax=Clastoptera arizonana TaxID=38151 RepID=A0A1B6DKC3_9HEMI